MHTIIQFKCYVLCVLDRKGLEKKSPKAQVMKSKLVIIIASIGILFTILLLTRSNDSVNDTNESIPNIETYDAKPQHLNDHSNHLFYFVQVSILLILIIKKIFT